MGACGHSRVREFILGGASLSMISKPTSTHFYHLWSWEPTSWPILKPWTKRNFLVLWKGLTPIKDYTATPR